MPSQPLSRAAHFQKMCTVAIRFIECASIAKTSTESQDLGPRDVAAAFWFTFEKSKAFAVVRHCQTSFVA